MNTFPVAPLFDSLSKHLNNISAVLYLVMTDLISSGVNGMKKGWEERVTTARTRHATVEERVPLSLSFVPSKTFLVS